MSGGETALKRTKLTPQHAALRAIETPALIVDVTVLKANIDAMSSCAKRAGLALRPHAKTHKSPEIASLQIKAGAVGIACATVAEAEMLARQGLPGLLLTAPQMGADRFERIARVNRDHGITVVVDHARQVEGLAATMGQDDRKLRVAIDIDVGQLRTGITDITEGVRIARMIAGDPAFHFAGVQGFAGHAQHIPDPEQRRQTAAKAAQTIRDVAWALTSVGLPPTLVTGSGTGTYEQDSEGPYNELQVGSYVFMDADYARILDSYGRGPAFTPSLFVLATVVSVNRPGQITVDAGVKALETNGPPPCEFIGAPAGSTYRFAGDEHGVIAVPAGAVAPDLGERILIGATHCDPTVNLHAAYHAVDGNDLTRWPILARYGA